MTESAAWDSLLRAGGILSPDGPERQTRLSARLGAFRSLAVFLERLLHRRLVRRSGHSGISAGPESAGNGERCSAEKALRQRTR